jgi:transglutaminase-like putative cysteine protease
MVRSITKLVALVFMCAIYVAPVSAEQVERGPEPRWVDRLPLPAPRHARLRQVQSGLYYLLLDTQVRSLDGIENYYTRSAYRVIDRGGLEEAARLEIEFNPSREHVVLHGITLWRRGVAYDRLRDAEIQVLHRETDLDKGVIDGRKTVHVEIKDVEVGDVVDYSYSWDADNDSWPQHFFGHATTAWSVPLEAWRYRVIRPSGTPLAIRNRNSRIAVSRTPSGPNTIYEWRLRDPDPVSDEADVPKWFPHFGVIAISSMTSWAEVVGSLLPLYSGKDALPPQLEARVAAAMAKYPKAEDRITWALHLVEDEFRYVSMSIDGSGSYSPRRPIDVLRSGYGDCKDKSQLLVALLRAMGIDAAVALTDIETGYGLPDEAPAPTLFGHAIVQVRFGGRSYWLDPTGSFEGGRFPNLATATYGWALPLRRDQTRLEQIPEAAAPAPTYRTTERYELGRGDHPGLTLTVDSFYRDGDADWMRSDLASKSQAQIEADYLDFYAKMYPGIVRQRPMQVTDDRGRNRIVVHEAYSLSPAALSRRKLATKFMVKASSMNDYDKVPNGRRETPYELTYPVNKEHTIVVVTPGRRPPAPEPVAFENAGFRYTMDVARTGDTLTLSYRMIGKKRFLAAREVADASDDADAISDDDAWYLDLTSTAGGIIGSKTEEPLTWTERAVEVLAAIGALALAALTVFGVRRGWAAIGRLPWDTIRQTSRSRSTT